MTKNEINKAIAEECGYTGLRYDWINGSDAIKDWMHDKGQGIPDYHGDLNAMHEAEKALTLQHRVDYMNNLSKVCSTEKEKPFSTASQRAEAFLRAIGKWKE